MSDRVRNGFILPAVLCAFGTLFTLWPPVDASSEVLEGSVQPAGLMSSPGSTTACTGHLRSIGSKGTIDEFGDCHGYPEVFCEEGLP